ncbi:MAG TPA: VOC family protein, partial [Propionicimonas sp.]
MTILTPQQFEEAGGTGDWRALNSGADAWFDTGSHVRGAVLVRRVADASGVRDLQVGIDALDVETVKAFWRAALGYVDDPRPGLHDLFDPRRLNPPVSFQQMDEPREQRNRIHLDLFVAADQAKARVSAAVAA